MRVFTGTAVVLSVVAAPLASAQPSIEVGSHDLLPNTPGQTIEVFVTGGQAIETVNLNVQVGDGTNTNGPTIQGVDAITGTLFAPPNNDGGQFDILRDPQVFATTVATPPGTTIAADGLLATIIIDTTGVNTGTYDLKLADTLNDDTDLGFDINLNKIEPTISNGQFTVVPEPASVLLLAASGVMLMHRRRRDS